MDSDRSRPSLLRRARLALIPALVLVAGASSAGCGGSALRRFPLRDPMWRDQDLDPVGMRCRKDPKPPKDDPSHKVCAPAEYESSFAWDGADNIIFRPISRFFAVDPPGEAANANSMDEVADSSWFTNRIGMHPMTPEEISTAVCGQKVLDPDAKDVTWTIDQGKPNGANPGFRVNVPGLGKFMLKSDSQEEPERATGATSIATRLYYAAGFWSACDSVVYFHPDMLKLKPGLTVTDNSGTTKPFDEKALKSLLQKASHRGELVRMVASRWLPGRTLGPFTYAGVRDDDPSDVVPHEDRRELRGARLLAAWTAHFDSREQNTMSTWMSADEKDPDASPGYVRHWYIDIGDAFGSQWQWDEMSKRLNHEYYLDIPYITEDFLTLGIPERPWDRAKKSVEAPIFGYFTSTDFRPELWRGGYPNPAFNRMTERDAAWMTRIIARFTRPHVEAAVKAGDYTRPEDTEYLVRHMMIRRQRILERYFAKVSPLADVRVTPDVPGTAQLCAVDLARATDTYPADRFRYSARLHAGATQVELVAPPVIAGTEGALCMTLRHTASEKGEADDAPSRYVVVDLANGQAERPLRVHLYDLGPVRGFRLAGVER
jgi:hypothetical protein